MTKKNIPLFLCSLLLSIINSSAQSFAQASGKSTSWITKWNHPKTFIENKGQFDERNKLPGSEILYAVDHGALQIFFTKTGLTYRLDKKEKNLNRREGDKSKPKFITETDFVHLTWEGANPSAVLTGEDMAQGHYTYAILKKDRSIYDINNIKGYKKLVYKNLYPNIDVEYVFHPETGIKYSLIVHPGADVSNVKMRYPDDRNITIDGSGNLHIFTAFGDIIDHAPVTYSVGNSSVIPSKFIQDGKTFSFQLDNYDNSKTVVVDPWVQTPTLANSNGVWECEKDGAGNVYIIGGDMPMILQKYNSAGAWQWTYNTPWDTANYWLGTLATDFAGNCYVTAGSLAKIQKISTGGALVWNNTGGSFDEYWNITFNCDQTKLITGGTRIVGLPSPTGDGVIFDINTSNGNMTSMKTVGYTRPYTITLPPPFGSQSVTDINEVRSISSSRNAKYYYLTLETVGYINQDLPSCNNALPYAINSTYSLGYKCENFRPDNGNAGIMAIRANGNFVYTQNGATIHKRSLANLAILSSAAIPGGISTSIANTTPTIYQPGNSGIDIDSCGNVYVGSANAVIKYDVDLNFITSVATPFSVFDVAVSYNGDVIVCGATGTSSSISRTGYVQSINMSACNPMILFCCDATVCPAGPYCTTDAPDTLTAVTAGGTWSGTGITNSTTGIFDPSVSDTGTFTIVYTLGCGSDSITVTVTCCGAIINPAGPFCITDAPVNLTAVQSGGTWTGNGITNSSTGTFDPSVAGAGTYTIVYTISGCGSDSVTITVNSCVVLAVCIETNGDLTASNGTAPYNWEAESTTLDCSSCPFGMCTPPICNGVNVTTWTSFGTTPTVTPPGTFPIRVTDNAGNTLLINSLAGLPDCSICTVTATTAANSASCGLSNGTATVTPSGGTAPYTYLWNNSQTTQTATGLSAGNYSVVVTDSSGCTVNGSVTVNGPFAISISLSSNPASCGIPNGSALATVTGGTGGYTYLWSPSGGTSSLATGLTAGTYTVIVTDSSACSSSDSIVVSNSSGPVAFISAFSDASCFNSNNGSAIVSASGGTGPYTFSWFPAGGTDSIATGLSAGNYTVSVTDAGGCLTTSSAVINAPPELMITISGSSISCFGGDGNAAVSAAGGIGSYTYLWSPTGDSTAFVNNLQAGTHSVNVTDSNGCAKSDSVLITEPSPILLSLSSSPASCGVSDGMAVAAVTGGTGAYTYQWSPAGGTADTTSGIPAGIYSVVVTDANACSITGNVIVNNTGGVSAAMAAVSNVSCFGYSNGSASVSVSGGTLPYTFSWSTNPVQTDSAATGLSAGTYNCTVADGDSCVAFVSVMITEPDSIVVTLTNDTSICGTQSVTISAVVSGGTPPYVYIWDNGLGNASSHLVSPLVTTTYTVIVLDADTCASLAQQLTVTLSPPITVTAGGQDTVCIGESAAITAFANGGDGAYTYLWSNGAMTNLTFVSPSNTTTYYVTVTDGCGNPPVTDSVTITITPALVLNPPSALICPGQSVTLTATGALEYWWMDFTTLDTLVAGPAITVSPVVTTNYLITANDGICEITDTATVYVMPAVMADFDFFPLVATIFNPEFTFNDQSGGTINYWSWNFGDGSGDSVQNPIHSYADTGTYQVFLLVSDSNACVDSLTQWVTVIGAYTLFTPNTFSPNGDGKNDYFLPYILGMEGDRFEMFIYDRWGDMVYKTDGSYVDFETSAPLIGWNGIVNYGDKTAQEDVYIWLVKTIDSDKKKHQYIGHVTLIR